MVYTIAIPLPSLGVRMEVWEVVSGSFVNFKLYMFDPNGQSISILRMGSFLHQVPETKKEEKNGENGA